MLTTIGTINMRFSNTVPLVSNQGGYVSLSAMSSQLFIYKATTIKLFLLAGERILNL